MKYLDKLKSRTEWQAFLLAVGVLFLNRFLNIGLTEADIYAMFGGAGAYAMGRGLAKSEGDSGIVSLAALASPDDTRGE